MIKNNRLTGKDDLFLPRLGSSDEKTLIEVYDKHVYERPSVGFNVKPGEVWADLGMNIGAFTVFASGIAGSVISYEADQTNFDLSNAHVLKNNRENVKTFRAAVVPDKFKERYVEFYVNKDVSRAWRHTLFKTNWETEKIIVPAIKFSHAIKNVDCIKMDIEGAEIPILLENPSLSHIKKMVFEWSFDRDNKISTARKVLAWLKVEFDHVAHPKLPLFSDTWDNFPFCMNVFCWRN